MLVDSIGRCAAPWRRGDRVQTRGRTWTLTDIEAGRDCAALSLAPDHPGDQLTLLAPFDRVTSATLRDRYILLSLPSFIDGLASAIASCQPAGSLRWAARAAIDLHPYQLEPALAIFRHGNTRVLIADDVGLGKTVEAGLILNELVQGRRATRALVLVPAGLREQWRHELRRLFGIEATIADAAWLTALTAEMPSDVSPWNMPGVFLGSQDFIKRPEVLRPLEDVTWDIVVVDEAHGCSVGTDRRAAVHAVASRAGRVVLLTATPPENPTDLAALCDIGRMSGEPRVVFFRRTREHVGQHSPRSSRLMFVRPTEAELRMHELLGKYAGLVWRESRLRGDDLARLAVITLRKRALSSGRSLAVSADRRLQILSGRDEIAEWQPSLPLDADEYVGEDAEPGEVVGAPGLADASRERRWLSAILEAARRAARNESKARWLRRFLDRVDEPAIVFTEYRDTLQRLHTTLGRNRNLLVLHGGMAAADRARIQRLFNESPSVLLATDAASEGLNLHHHCRLVIHYELPWSTARLEQRAGRVDRLGQSRPVHEVALVARTDAERVVLGPLMQRASVASSGGLAAALTESQVAALIFGENFEPDRCPASSTPPLLPSSFHEEAARETERLARLRQLPASAEPQSVSYVMVTRARLRRGQLEPGIVALYQLSLVDRAGTSWHSQVIALRVMLNGPTPRTKIRLGRLVSELTHTRDPRLARSLAPCMEQALTQSFEVFRVCTSALRRRDDCRAALGASAARHLVQAGLFEIRGSPRETRMRGAAMDELEPSAATVLCLEVRLIGVLDVRRS
jgi:superfamily II DNA or RNA helicase